MKIKSPVGGALIISGLLGLYAISGFYLIPAVARHKLPPLVAELTGRQPRLQAVHFNPFTLRVEIEGFGLNIDNDQPLLSFEYLVVDLDAVESISKRGVVLDQVVLRKPEINVARRADGSFNFNDLMPKAAEPENTPAAEEPSPPLALLVHNLTIEGGRAAWSDALLPEPANESVMPIDLTVDEFNTLPDGPAKFALAFDIASGGHLEWHGDFSLAAMTSNGKLKLDKLALPKLWQLFPRDSLPLDISDGELSLQADYQFNGIEPAINVSVSNAGLDIQRLVLAETAKPDPLIEIPALKVSGVAVDVGKQQISIASLSSQDAVIKAWLQADGQLNYQRLFVGEAPAAPATAQVAPVADAETSAAWQVRLDELALTNYKVQFSDLGPAKPVDVVLSEMNCKLTQFSTAAGAKLPLQFAAKFNQSGSLKLTGDMVLEPFSADWDLDIRNIELNGFESYIDPFVKLDLIDGEFSTQGHLRLETANELQVVYRGDASVDNLLTRDKIKNKDFVKWARLDLNQLAIDVAKQQYGLGKVTLDKPYVRFMIKKEGTTNFDEIIVSPSEEGPAVKPQAPPVPAKAGAEPTISIGKIEVKDGRSDFADYSLILPFVAEMNSLKGEVDGFASNSNKAAKLKLQGKVYDLATVAIKGNYQFNNGDSNIALNFTHMPLPLVTPYMAEFAGYKIEKGQMALELQYSLQHAQLQAQNKILIDQLTLGEKVDNPKAVSLPLNLAIALLKDSDGKINLDFPISGSLEDPQFSVGALVADVLVNVVKKVVASPFKAIASMFDDDVDPSNVVFAPGSSEISPEQGAKLAQVGSALAGKPELVLEIKGIAYQAQDWSVLRFDALTEILKKMKSGELRDKGEKIRSEYIELSEDEYKRLLAKFYAEVFPNEIDYSVLGKPRMKHNPDVEFYDTARKQLEAIMPPEPQRLDKLAVERANRIAKYLSEQAGVDRSRIYILATEAQTGEANAPAQALLSLNVGH